MRNTNRCQSRIGAKDNVAARGRAFSRTSAPALLLQPFSKKSRTPTAAKVFQIGLYDPAESDFELFCNNWSAGFFGERL